ncbi:MAG: nuclear transport factor 2 family protein [Bacteroidota bacterium]
MTPEECIHHFYNSFAEKDHQGMASCYHSEIVFSDPAFGELKGEKLSKMWEMLLSNPNSELKVTYSDVQADELHGSANWTAEYNFGSQSRKVVNHIQAKFEFKDGLIVKHTDHFNLWKWSRQALGTTGLLLGWSPLVKNKVKSMANGMLDKFMGE